MLSTSQAFVDKFKRAYSATSDSQVTFEWNMNRFGTLDKVTNNGVEPVEKDLYFPLESIVDPRRPTKASILKAVVTTGSLGIEAPARTSSGIPSERRTYVADADAKYKYWLSSTVSSATSGADGYAISQVSPAVTWTNDLRTNKISVLFETTASKPSKVTLQITTDGTNWTSIAGSFVPDSNGAINLWLQDNGTWSATKNLKNVKALRGLKATVVAMDKPSTHCHVIELALKREVDLTSRTVDFSFTYDASDASFVAPLGKATSGTGSISLSNFDGYLDNKNTASDLMGMMDSPAKVTVVTTTTADGESATTPVATMYVENWGDESDDSRSLTLSDASAFLKKEYPPALLFQQATGTEVIWRLLDAVGFVDFSVDESPDGDMKVDYFWTDPERTVWDHIQEISEALQIAVYFDATGTLRIRTRERVYDKDQSTPDWTFDASKVTTELATEQGRPGDAGKVTDIIDVTTPISLHANKVTVQYTPTSVSDINKNQPEMEVVWQPEGESVVLRSASLAADLPNDQGYGYFSGSNFATWPYEGYIQLEGEVLKWTKKRYKYVDENDAWQTKWIATDAEKDVLDSKSPRRSHMNQFDGGLYFGTEGRGLMSTVARTHTVSPGHGFNSIRTRHGSQSIIDKPWYVRPLPKESVFRIQTSDLFDAYSWTIAKRGDGAQSAPRYLGTSLKFDTGSAYTHGIAGLFLGGGTMDSGYFIELRTTASVGTRKSSNELSFYVRKADGSIKRIGKGEVAAVEKGRWYDLDVFQMIEGGYLVITVMLNGIQAMKVSVPSSDIISIPLSGRYGVYARGMTHVNFEYLYAANSLEDVPFGGDESSRWDLIEGGFRSNYYNNYLYKNEINNRLTNYSENRMTMNTGFYMDEFGVKGHEVRTFKAEFEPNPVIHSRLYMSNEWFASCTEYTSNHHSAEFTLFGKGRDIVIVHGEDNTIYGSDSPVDQKLLIYGRVVDAKDAESYEVSNEASIRRSGEVEVTIESPWIQSEAAAKKIGDWVAGHWGDGSESITVKTFGNPLLEIGDLVSISFPRKSMAPETHQYYITGVSLEFSEGLKTEFSLQRKITSSL